VKQDYKKTSVFQKEIDKAKESPQISISQWRLPIRKRLRSLDKVKITGLLHPPGHGEDYHIF
jgi:predicted ATP-binding protein involved in virulence